MMSQTLRIEGYRDSIDSNQYETVMRCLASIARGIIKSKDAGVTTPNTDIIRQLVWNARSPDIHIDPAVVEAISSIRVDERHRRHNRYYSGVEICDILFGKD